MHIRNACIHALHGIHVRVLACVHAREIEAAAALVCGNDKAIYGCSVTPMPLYSRCTWRTNLGVHYPVASIIDSVEGLSYAHSRRAESTLQTCCKTMDCLS